MIFKDCSQGNKLLVSVVILCFAFFEINGQEFYKVPEQKMDLLKYSNFDISFEAIVPEIEISEFITLGEYNEFLKDVETDSTKAYYYSVLPDSSITKCVEVYTEYISNRDFDNYPVVGISWESALEYCKWRTKKEQNSTEMEYYYRLPLTSEWISVYSFVKENRLENDFNNVYSDLLYSSVDETIISSILKESNFAFDRVHYIKYGESNSQNRKRIIGSNYKFSQKIFLNSGSCLLAGEGRAYVAFRIVKVPMSRNEKLMQYFNF